MLLPAENDENRDVFRKIINYAQGSILFILLIVIYIWQNITVADLEYNLKRMEDHVIQLQKEQNKLETEITFLNSPERIGQIAEKELNLVLIKPEEIIWIETTKEDSISIEKMVKGPLETKSRIKEN